MANVGYDLVAEYLWFKYFYLLRHPEAVWQRTPEKQFSDIDFIENGIPISAKVVRQWFKAMLKEIYLVIPVGSTPWECDKRLDGWWPKSKAKEYLWAMPTNPGEFTVQRVKREDLNYIEKPLEYLASTHSRNWDAWGYKVYWSEVPHQQEILTGRLDVWEEIKRIREKNYEG